MRRREQTGPGGAVATRASIFGAAVVLGLGPAAPVSPAVIHDLEVTRHHGRYELIAHTFLEAPVRGIYAVLTDYDDDAYGRISGIYKQSGYLGHEADGTPLVYTLVRGCVLFFCRDMRRVSRLVVRPPTYIRTTALPARSDFKYSSSQWWLAPVEDGTEVTYRLVMEPDFWVPPLIGPWVLKRRFMEGGRRALGRIERLARAEESSAPSSPARPAEGP